MQKLEKLISIAKQKVDAKKIDEEQEAYNRMSVKQLKELLYDNPSEERIREIFDSVGGLHLLE